MMIGMGLCAAIATSVDSYSSHNNTCWKFDSQTETTFNTCTGEIKP